MSVDATGRDHLFCTFPNRLCFSSKFHTQPFCCAPSKSTYDLTPFSIHLIFPPLTPKSMTRRQSLSCWGLSYSILTCAYPHLHPFHFHFPNEETGHTHFMSYPFWDWTEHLSQVQVYKGIHTLASLHPCRTNTLFPKKWLLPLLQLESSESLVRYILQSIRLIVIIQATSICSFDWSPSCRFSVVTSTTVSETPTTIEPWYHDAFFICMSYSTIARVMLTSSSSLRTKTCL